MRVRVVFGEPAVMATLRPRIWFRSVDLPTFGLPTRATKPERNSGSGSSRPACRSTVPRRVAHRGGLVTGRAPEPPGLIGPLGQPLLVGLAGPGVQRRSLEPHRRAHCRSVVPAPSRRRGDGRRPRSTRPLSGHARSRRARGRRWCPSPPWAARRRGTRSPRPRPSCDETRNWPPAERHDQGLVDVELVDDLAHELLDEVLEGHDAGGARRTRR